MTIIVADAKARVMVADTLIICSEYTKGFYSHKIRRCNDGSLVGASGSSSNCAEFLNWAQNGRKSEIDYAIFDECMGIALDKDGSIYIFKHSKPDRIIGDFAAIGSGQDAALGARYFKHTAEECVMAAISACAGCGGELTILHLDDE